ncbi:MAG: LytR C-terminal domain-containing protein [Minisyncoccia bacterium]
MSQFIKKIRASVSEIKPKDLVYPGIALFFAIIVGVIFVLATGFIAKSIDTAFSGDTGEESSSLNMENYTLVARKLGISIEINKEEAVVQVEPSIPSESQATTTTQVLDKKAFTLNILNSTPKSGVAGALATSLTVAGFAQAKTGNEKTLYATTTVFIKESKSDIGPSLLEIVKKTYPDAVSTTSPETALFDVIIIIGTK